MALRWHGREDVRIEDVPLRLDLEPAMVEVEVAYCGICGSDVAEYREGPFAIRRRPHQLTGQEPPLTLGHEFSGRVTAIGSAVSGIAVGQRVAADACWRCNACPACRSGRYNLCAKGGSIGLASDGAFASKVRFPAYCVVPIPDDVSDTAAALLEPLAVGLHALERGATRPDDIVVILGYGAIGAATAAVATAMGVQVLVSEPHPGRRAHAEARGHATFCPVGDARDVSRAVRELTDGGAQHVIDCSGAATALAAAPDMTTRGGNVVLVGLPKSAPGIDAARLVLYERALIGSLGYAEDLPRVAEMIAAGTLDAEQLITRTIPLRDAPKMFEAMAVDPGDDIKVLVQPGAA